LVLIWNILDLAQHFFVKHNITAIRRVRMSDNNRIARVSGATIVNRTEEIQESDVGTGTKIDFLFFLYLKKRLFPSFLSFLIEV
jgi:T-complex protein 1 subunit gamma